MKRRQITIGELVQFMTSEKTGIEFKRVQPKIQSNKSGEMDGERVKMKIIARSFLF